ncbi:hypothetical protein N431DRAFT_59813 [Stipitochalara longipes BDJ]|nr:hypothetical protein N431DRAFT_59813 [Stipitochalara longipes BDJ]
MMQVSRFQSAFVLLFAALCCVVTAVDPILDDEEAYGIIMARMPMLYREWTLTKRDVCADAIPGTKTTICTPGNTLCCTPNNTNTAFPQCQTILGSGYCCVSENGCYIDTPSDCGAANSIPCSMLVSGVDEACCPPFTTCPNNFNQSSTVRCNIVQNAVSSSTSSTKSSPTTSTSSSPSSSAASKTTSSAPSDTLSPVTQSGSSASPSATGINVTSSSTLSPGADAGIGIGVALVIIAIAGLAFWAYRRGKKKGAAARTAEAQAALGNQMSPGIQHQQYDPIKYSDVPQYQQGFQQHELSAHRPYNAAAELGGTGQHELP